MSDLSERKRTARLAGLLFFLWIISGFYDMMYVSPKIFVSGDNAASAQNILQHELLFRTGIFSGLVTNVLWILLVWVFYKLFKPVHQQYAKLLVYFVLVQIPVAFSTVGFRVAALLALKAEALKSFDPTQRNDLAMLFLKLNDYSVLGLELFWGLWLFLLALLVYHSGFIPRLIGVWLIINGIVYVVLSFTSIVFPDYKDLVFTYGMPAMFGELVLMFWLLIKGTRDTPVVESK